MKKELDQEYIHIKCPHCRSELEKVWVIKCEAYLAVRNYYFCTECSKELQIRNFELQTIEVHV